MPVTASDIRAAFQKVELSVQIAGATVSNCVAANCSAGQFQKNSEATLTFTSRPSGNDGDQVNAWAGYNGNTSQIYEGLLTGTAWSYDGSADVNLGATGRLSLVQRPWGKADREYINQDEAAVIRNLLEAWGIPSSKHHIEQWTSAGVWILGVIEPVIAAKGSRFIDLIEEIDRLRGYSTYDHLNGAVYSRPIGEAPGVPVFTFTQGVDGVRIARTQEHGEIRNHIITHGLIWQGVEIDGEAQAANAYLDSLVAPELRPYYISEEISSNLMETPARVQAVADRMLAYKNKRSHGFEITAIGNPIVNPGDTVTVNYSAVEANLNVVCRHVAHAVTANEYTTVLRTDGGAMV